MNHLDITIGFTQSIQRTWLDFTVQQLLADNSPANIRMALNDQLSHQLSASHRQKAINILAKIWLNRSKPLESFRTTGLVLYQQVSKTEQIAIHWGMSLAVYPFFSIVAEHIGRLLRLQQTVATEQLQKRLRDKLGDRKIVTVAARRLLQSWVDWKILGVAAESNVYVAQKHLAITDTQLTSWLLESILIARQGQPAQLDQLLNYTPTLFPFRLSSNYFIPNERLELFNQGVHEVGIAFKYSHKTD